MSLQVWLPLTQDLRNQGLCGVNVLNNGATLNSSGKLGQCYSFNGSSNYLYMNYNFYSSKYTFSTWIYTTSTSATQGICIDRTTVGYGFATFLIGGKLRIDCGGNNLQWTTNYTYPANTWFHLTVTYDGSNVAYYINGEYKEKKAQALASTYWGNITSFGASQANGSNYGNYLNGRLNDVRIYNNCLSAEEVKEISKGLILHYPLSNRNFGQENILSNSSGHAGTSSWSGLVTVGYENGVPYLIAKRTDTTSSSRTFCTHSAITSYVSTWTPGSTQFVLSGYYKVPSTETFAVGANMFIRWGPSSNTSDTGFTVATTTERDIWIYFEKVFTVPSSYTTDQSVNFYLSAFSKGLATIYWKNIKMEKGNIATPWSPAKADTLYTTLKLSNGIEYDCSGYNINGTQVGTLTYDSNSPIYNVSTYISNGANVRINTPELTLPKDAITLNIWFRSTNTSPTGNYHMVVDSVANRQWYEICINNTGYLRAGLFVNGTRYADNCTTKTALNGNWHMLTITYDGTIIKRYFDGVMEKSTSVTASTGLSSPTAITLGRDGPSASYACVDAYLSDFRIYATALSADDIQSLYNLKK